MRELVSMISATLSLLWDFLIPDICQQGLLLAKPFCTQALGLICPMLRGVIGANRGGEKCDGGMQAPIYQQDST